MEIRRNLLWICLLLSALATETVTAQTGIVTGRVVESGTGTSLIGANVYLKSDMSKGAVTDYNGYFRLELPAGKQWIEISYTGMKSKTIPVTVKADSKVSLKTISLEPESYTVQELVVRAGKFNKKIEDQTVSIEVMKPKIIQARNTQNIATILDLTPGVTILDDEPQIRGGSGYTYGVGSKVGVFIDGIPIASPDAGKPDWSFIPVENIKQVEVIKGASSVLSGSSALSGAIYVRTKYPGIKPKTYVNTYFGTYTSPPKPAEKWWNGPAPVTGISFSHTRRVGDGHTDLVLGGNIRYDHNYQGPAVVIPPIVDSSGITKKDMANRLFRFNFGIRRRSKKTDGLNFGVNANFMRQKNAVAMAWLDDTTGFYRGYPDAILKSNQFTFYVDPFINFYSKNGARHEFISRVMYSNSLANLDQSSRGMLIYNKYEFRKQLKKVGKTDLITGVVSSYNRSVAHMYSGSGSDTNFLWNVSWYTEVEKKYGDRVNLSFGVRFEYFNLNREIKKVKPIFRFGSSFHVGLGTYLRASIGQGYRFPTIAERYVHSNMGAFGVFDNPDLKPESSWNAEVGIKQAFKWKEFRGYADVAFFYQEYKNTVEYLFGFWDSTYQFAYAGFKFVNTGASQVTGIDFSLTGQARLGHHTTLNVMAGYTYVHPVTLEPDYVFAHDFNPGGQTAFSYNTTSVNPESRVLKYRFLHTAKLDLELDFKRFAVGTSMRYFSKIVNLDKAIFDFEDVTRATGGTLQAILYRNYYHHHNNGNMIWDVRASYEISKHSKISILSNNVGNRMYSLRPLKAEPPRSLTLRYSLSL
jgi:outer membrane receptor protein involved in Fe transport